MGACPIVPAFEGDPEGDRCSGGRGFVITSHLHGTRGHHVRTSALCVPRESPSSHPRFLHDSTIWIFGPWL
jgi:hypothetical protein